MSIPDFDKLSDLVSKEADKVSKAINPNGEEWRAIRRYLLLRRWQLGDQILRGGPPEAVECIRGKAQMLSELLTLGGQSDSEG